MEIAADEHRATAMLSARIDERIAREADVIAKDLDVAAVVEATRARHAAGIEERLAARLEDDAAVFAAHRAIGAHEAALVHERSVDPDGAALGDDAPDVHGAIGRRAHDDLQRGARGIDQLDVMAGREHHLAAR